MDSSLAVVDVHGDTVLEGDTLDADSVTSLDMADLNEEADLASALWDDRRGGHIQQLEVAFGVQPQPVPAPPTGPTLPTEGLTCPPHRWGKPPRPVKRPTLAPLAEPAAKTPALWKGPWWPSPSDSSPCPGAQRTQASNQAPKRKGSADPLSEELGKDIFVFAHKIFYFMYTV